MPGLRLRFAEFELDCERYQLCRNGQPVRLEGIPLQLLIFLAEHPCQLVTRGQIATRCGASKCLWIVQPASTQQSARCAGHSATIPRSPSICRRWWEGDIDLSQISNLWARRILSAPKKSAEP